MANFMVLILLVIYFQKFENQPIFKEKWAAADKDGLVGVTAENFKYAGHKSIS